MTPDPLPLEDLLVRQAVRKFEPRLLPDLDLVEPRTKKVRISTLAARARLKELEETLGNAAKQFVALAEGLPGAVGSERRAFAIKGVTEVLDIAEAGVEIALPNWWVTRAFRRIRDGISDLVQQVYEARKPKGGGS